MPEGDTPNLTPTTPPTSDPASAADPAATPPVGDPPADPATPPAADDSTILGGDPVADPPADPGAAAEPVIPEHYELTMPEGVTLDEESLALVEPVFKDIKLTQEAAQKIADVFPSIAEKIAQRSTEAANNRILTEVVAQRKEWAEGCQKDPVYGGPNFDASKANAAKFIDQFGGDQLRSILNDSGLGNHPALFAACAKAGAMLAEDQDASHGETTNTKPATLGEKYYGPAS